LFIEAISSVFVSKQSSLESVLTLWNWSLSK
jgi:hypothetical protein